MKLINIILILTIIFFSLIFNVFADNNVPTDINTLTLNKVSQEHKTTREYLNNELKKSQKLFFDEFIEKADYYEKSYKKLLNGAVYKLGFLWAGILLFFVSFNKLLQTKTEKKKYNVLKEAITNDIEKEFNINKNIQLPNKEVNNVVNNKQKEHISDSLSNLFKKKKNELKKNKQSDEKNQAKKKISSMIEKLKKMEKDLNVNS